MKKLILSLALLAGTCMYTQAQTTVNLVPEKDNTLYENASGSLSNGAGDHFFVGTTGSNRIRRSVIKFDVAGSIPAGATITSVTLTLSMDQTISGPNSIGLYTLSTNWGEGSSFAGGGGGGGAASATNDATWIHTFYPGSMWTNPGGDYNASASATTAVNGVGAYTWNSSQMASDVQAWLDAGATNFGWELIGDESVSSTAKRFASREFSSATEQPMLAVTYTVPCNDPVLTAVTASPASVCSGGSSTITVNGSLNDATAWHLYSGSCGGTAVTSNTSGVFSVSPAATTNYFVRAEGGCVTASTCDSALVTVIPANDPAFSYSSSSFCANDTDPAATITGTSGGTFSAAPAGIIINPSTGSIDLAASTPGTYSVTYDPGGSCPVSASHVITINNVYSTTDTQSICSGLSYSFGTQTLSSAGIYTETFTSVTGCDSTVTLTFSVATVDTSVTVSGNGITANSSAGTFQWFDCGLNAPIAGETDSLFMAMADGNYSVIVTENGCIDTSDCVNIIILCTCPVNSSAFTLSKIKAFPNPSTEKLSIDLGKSYEAAIVELLDAHGKLIFTRSSEGKQLLELETENLKTGIYFLKVNSPEGVSVSKIIKE
ncbi:MAG: hypothetical protein JWO09_3869 [Bacteroidetes bacterium]|nr:hypothetical protein [Bacteroidota bacterium]